VIVSSEFTVADPVLDQCASADSGRYLLLRFFCSDFAPFASFITHYSQLQSMVAGQRLQNILQTRGITQCNHMTFRTSMQRIAIPIAHHAACTLYHRHKRGKVMQFQPSLDNDIDMARGE
jgi:hypothetical protein